MSDCCQKKIRSDQLKKELVNRLNRIEGQIRGLRGMVERDEYCVDILTQTSAARSALSGFEGALLTDHINTCVTQDVKNGSSEKTDELISMLRKMLK